AQPIKAPTAITPVSTPSSNPPAAAGWKEGRAAGSICTASITLVTAKSRVLTSNTGDFVPTSSAPDPPHRSRGHRDRNRGCGDDHLPQEPPEARPRGEATGGSRAECLKERPGPVRPGARRRSGQPPHPPRRLLRRPHRHARLHVHGRGHELDVDAGTAAPPRELPDRPTGRRDPQGPDPGLCIPSPATLRPY